MSLLRFKEVSLAFGLSPLLDRANLVIEPLERVSLIGRNGAGKSTLLKVIAGLVHADEGEVIRSSALNVAYLPQEVPSRDDVKVFSVVAEGLQELGLWLTEYDALSKSSGEVDLARMEWLQHKIEAQDGWRLRQKVETAMQRLQVPADTMMGELSGGWKRRVFLARALVQEPNLLLLDEPTNHLDIEMIQWLEEELLQFRGGVLFISHDRMFIDRLATRIIELDRGRLTSWPAPYNAYLEKKEQQLAAEEKEWERFDKKLAEEEVWIRQGIKARRTRNEGRVRALKALRDERTQRRDRIGQVNLRVSEENSSGKIIAEFDNVSFSYSEEKKILQDFSWSMMRKDRVGLLGPNGCGKSTFIKLVLGELEAGTGNIKRGTKQQVAYFDQLRDQIDLEATVWDNVAKGKDFITLPDREVHVAGYLREFLFPPERLRTPAKALSGGEVNRLLLAKLFTRPANILVLDEPTNDLDMDTLDLLEEMLANFDGSILLVSHDRTFIDNVVTSCLVFEGDGQVVEYAGGYSDWLVQRPVIERASVRKGVDQSAAVKKGGNVAKSEQSGAAAKKKLSYKLQRELDQLPADVEALEASIADLQTEMAAQGFYEQSHEKVAERLALMQSQEAELEALMERWLELEEMQG